MSDDEKSLKYSIIVCIIIVSIYSLCICLRFCINQFSRRNSELLRTNQENMVEIVRDIEMVVL